MNAYLPIANSIAGGIGRGLNELHEKKAYANQIAKYRNKIPQWCDEANSYVLNFGGRATISSVKNFQLVR